MSSIALLLVDFSFRRRHWYPLPFHPATGKAIYLSVSLSSCLSLSICLCHLRVFLSVYLSSGCLSIYPCFIMFPSIHRSIYLSLALSPTPPLCECMDSALQALHQLKLQTSPYQLVNLLQAMSTKHTLQEVMMILS